VKFFLTIENDAVVVKTDYVAQAVASEAELAAFIASSAKAAGVANEDLSVLASSSLDFPEEFTSNKATIALAKALKAA